MAKTHVAAALGLLAAMALAVVLLAPEAPAGTDVSRTSAMGQGPQDFGMTTGKALRSTSSRLDGREYVPDEILIRYRDDMSVRGRRLLAQGVGIRGMKRLGTLVPGLVKAGLRRGVTVAEAVSACERDPGVLYAQPNYVVRALAVPDDPGLPEQWALDNRAQTGGTADADIDAPRAWDISTGSRAVVVAVLDTGIDYTNPDVRPNLWRNPGETPGNGIDDDDNGYVDDVFGADTMSGSGDPLDRQGHGTHCAGIVGARGDNGIGLTGVNWNVRIMTVKVLNDEGYGTTESVLKGFEYMDEMGARLSSNSWGGDPWNRAEHDAIKGIHKLFVFAAGNDGADNDATPFYPASYRLRNIVSVGASDHDDALADFSNHGKSSVDVLAPGVDIVSTLPARHTFRPVVGATLFSDSMDDLDAWVQRTGPEAEPHPWEITSSACVSSFASAAILDYGDLQSSELDLKAPLDLTSTGPVYVNLKARYDLQKGKDVALVTAGPPGADSRVLLATITGSSEGRFEDIWVDASPLVGLADVRFSIYFISDDSVSSADGYEGIFVDDVRVVTPQSRLLASETFSDPQLPGWSGLAVTNPWRTSSARSISPPFSLAQSDAAGSGQYSDNDVAEIERSAGLDPGSSGLAFMSYKLWLSTAPGDDGMAPSFNTGAGPFMAGREIKGSTGGWTTQRTAAVGGVGVHDIRFGFAFWSDGAGVAEGAYVDDVEFRAVDGEWDPPAYETEAWSGTSMAAPYAAGIAALALSQAPGMDATTLKRVLMTSVDRRPGLSSTCVSGGRVNAFRTVRSVSGHVRGRVECSGRRLSGVAVAIGSRVKTRTGPRGTYRTAPVRPGVYRIAFSKQGFRTRVLTRVVVDMGCTVVRNVELERAHSRREY